MDYNLRISWRCCESIGIRHLRNWRVIAGTIPYVGLYFGLALIGVAGAIFFFHSAVGYQLAIISGIQQPAVVVKGMGDVWIELINGIVWGTVYGVIGFLIDRVRNRQRRIEPNTTGDKCNAEDI